MTAVTIIGLVILALFVLKYEKKQKALAEMHRAKVEQYRKVKIDNPDHPYEWTFTDTKVSEPEYHFVDRSGQKDPDGSGSSTP